MKYAYERWVGEQGGLLPSVLPAPAPIKRARSRSTGTALGDRSAAPVTGGTVVHVSLPSLSLLRSTLNLLTAKKVKSDYNEEREIYILRYLSSHSTNELPPTAFTLLSDMWYINHYNMLNANGW